MDTIINYDLYSFYSYIATIASIAQSMEMKVITLYS